MGNGGTRKMILQSSRFRIYELNDNGIYMAMNFGLAKSKGKYCLFLNAGDELVSENTVDSMIKEIKANKSKEHYHLALFIHTKELIIRFVAQSSFCGK